MSTRRRRSLPLLRPVRLPASPACIWCSVATAITAVCKMAIAACAAVLHTIWQGGLRLGQSGRPHGRSQPTVCRTNAAVSAAAAAAACGWMTFTFREVRKTDESSPAMLVQVSRCMPLVLPCAAATSGKHCQLVDTRRTRRVCTCCSAHLWLWAWPLEVAARSPVAVLVVRRSRPPLQPAALAAGRPSQAAPAVLGVHWVL